MLKMPLRRLQILSPHLQKIYGCRYLRGEANRQAFSNLVQILNMRKAFLLSWILSMEDNLHINGGDAH